MISKSMEKALNKQIQLEGEASFLYLSMASWCDGKGLEGCAEFLHRQSMEEHGHMMKIFHYISEVDGSAVSPGIKQPPKQFASVTKLLQQVYEHEKKVTASINKLTDLSYKENDYSTLNFLQWYIEEQREEENLMRSILDKVALIGEGPQKLYFIDMEMKRINEVEQAKENSEATN